MAVPSGCLRCLPCWILGGAHRSDEPALKQAKCRTFSRQFPSSWPAPDSGEPGEWVWPTSHEIHDNISQTLAALDLELSVVASDLSGAVSLEVTLAHMKAISHLLTATVEWSERLSAGLRLSLLDNLGLAAAIGSAAREFGSRTGIVVIARPLENIGMTRELSTAIFRVVEEGLTLVRHANATEVSISLRRQDHGVLLQIRHNGMRVANEELTGPWSFELLALRERVRSFGGRTRIEDVAGGGVTISIRDSDFGADSAKRRGRLVVHVSANAPERAAVGNVTGTTMNEQLLLRQP